MAKKIKFKGYVKDYRTDIEKEKTLTDPETRLFRLYIRIVDWDKKHRDTFGSSEATIRNIKEYYLPNWSIGKICEKRKTLIEKRFLEKKNRRTYIIDCDIYINNTQKTEQKLQLSEQAVQLSEFPFQQDEKTKTKEPIVFSLENSSYVNKNKNFVQQTEQYHKPKENLKKLKENLKKLDNDIFKESDKNEWLDYINNIRPKIITNRNLNTKDFPLSTYNK